MIQRCQLLLFLFLYASCVFFCPHIWAEKKAQLRRFKDGAIIHAVVWSDIENDVKRGRVQLENGAKTGDTVERNRRILTPYLHDLRTMTKLNNQRLEGTKLS